jgi:hypothetical protein
LSVGSLLMRIRPLCAIAAHDVRVDAKRAHHSHLSNL